MGHVLFMVKNFPKNYVLETYTLQYDIKFLSHLNGLYTNVCGMHSGGGNTFIHS